MTHLKVVEININVVNIRTKEEHEAASITVQDRVTSSVSSESPFAVEKTV